MAPDRTVHRLLLDDLPEGLGVGERVVASGEEARHAARVKRLEIGEPVEVFNGRGLVAHGRVDAVAGSRQHPEVVVELAGPVVLSEPARPRVEVWCPMPGIDRASGLVEQLSQCGAAAWVPMRTERAQRAPTGGQLEKLRRVARESAKQCGRAWVLDVREPDTLERALCADGTVLVLDATGGPFGGIGGVGGAQAVRLFVGPEGGWSDAERARLAGATMVCAGPHVLRLETAAVVGTALVMAHAEAPLKE